MIDYSGTGFIIILPTPEHRRREYFGGDRFAHLLYYALTCHK